MTTIQNLFLLEGSDSYLLDREISRIAKLFSPVLTDPIRLSGEKSDVIQTLIFEVSSPSLFNPIKWIIWSIVSTALKTDVPALISLIEKLPSDTILIIRAKIADRRNRLYKTVEAKGSIVFCGPLSERELPRFIADMANQLGVTLHPSAMRYLIDQVEGNLATIYSELCKAASLAGGSGKPIELKHLENGLAPQKAASIFEFTDALGFKMAARAGAFLEDLLKQKEPPLKILTMIARQMRILLKAKLSAKTGTSSERSKAIGVHPYFLKAVDQQADAWPTSALKSTFAVLAQIDERLKSEAVRPEDELRLLVLKLCGS